VHTCARAYNIVHFRASVLILISLLHRSSLFNHVMETNACVCGTPPPSLPKLQTCFLSFCPVEKLTEPHVGRLVKVGIAVGKRKAESCSKSSILHVRGPPRKERGGRPDLLCRAWGRHRPADTFTFPLNLLSPNLSGLQARDCLATLKCQLLLLHFMERKLVSGGLQACGKRHVPSKASGRRRHPRRRKTRAGCRSPGRWAARRHAKA